MILKPNFRLQCGPFDKSLPTGLIVMMLFIEFVKHTVETLAVVLKQFL